MENEEKTIQPKAIQIFAKAPGELGVNVVKSPVKLTILSMLKSLLTPNIVHIDLLLPSRKPE